MSRKLVTIRKVKEIQKIENADRIELLKVEGWQCVVKKNQFEEGDLGIYFEVDSFLPIIPQFEFLGESSKKTMIGDKGYVIKTRKLRKVLSQGLFLNFSDFPKIDFSNFLENDDLTDLFNVKVYEPPVSPQLAGLARGNFPNFLIKTDQERIQNIFNKIKNKYLNRKWLIDLKMDGTSCTVYFNNNEFGVCSRNLELKESDENIYWKVVKRLKLKERLTKLCKERNINISIQGEICGEGIQKNRGKISIHNLFIFNIFDIDNKKFLNSVNRYKIIDLLNKDKTYEQLKITPIIFNNKILFKKETTLDDLLKLSEGLTENKTIREGIVCKLITDNLDERVESFKVINNKYLLKH